MAEPAPKLALRAICAELARRGTQFALVGGLAVSVRAEVRFTRDVDIVVNVLDDRAAEELVDETCVTWSGNESEWLVNSAASPSQWPRNRG